MKPKNPMKNSNLSRRVLRNLYPVLFCFGVTVRALDVPMPVVRYTFDAPFGFEEANAVGTGYPAIIPRNSVQQGPPRRSPGVFGNAVSPGVRQNIRSTFPAGKEFTVSFWMLPLKLDAPDVFRLGDLLRIGIERHHPNLVAQMGQTSISTPIETGEWACLVLVSTGLELVLYLDGREVGRAEGTLKDHPYGQEMTFAGIRSAHHLFRGLIDEFRVYDIALTSEQVARISDKDQTLQTVPPVADAGIVHTVYLEPDGGVRVPLEGRISEGAISRAMWSVARKPADADVIFADATSLTTTAHFTVPGVYTLQLAIESPRGTSIDETRIVVFPPHPERAPALLHENPDVPGTYITSFTNDNRGTPYDSAFVAEHFPEGDAPLQLEGFARERFREPPPPYVHPRIFFNPEDLPAMRQRIRYNLAASSAYASVRRMYEMKTRGKDIPDDHIQKEFNENNKRYHFTFNKEAAAGYAMGAYIALVEGDGDLARKLIEASVRLAELQHESLDKLEGWRKHDWQGAPHQVLGRYATAYVYDFLYPWMTQEEQDLLRGVLSKATRGMRAIGMFSVPQAVGRSNWVCWMTGDLLANVLAIEGEDGYDPVVFEEAANAMMKFSHYGILPDGSSFEGMGKNSITGENLVAMAKRGYDAIVSENIYNFHTRFQLNVMQPYGNHFIADDLWGHSRFAGNSPDAAVIKFAYPDDPVVDFVYRNAVKGARYWTPLFRTTYGYNSALVNCWFGEDWTGPSDWNAHAAKALEGKPLDMHFNYSNIATARSGWEKDSVYLYFLPRMLGGHNSPSRGTFVFSALGRDWSLYPSGHNNKSTLQHSVITVDGKSIRPNWARMTAFDSTPERMIAAADLRDIYTNRATLQRSQNDFRVKPAPGPWFDLPVWQLPDWQAGNRPQYAESPEPEAREPARAAYRVVALVREEKPYAVILDEMNIDDQPHSYRWQMVLPPDLRGQVEIQGNDAVITDPATGNAVLVRPVESSADFVVTVEETEWAKGVIAFESQTPAWTFAMVLMPVRKGDPVPQDAEIPRLKQTVTEMRAMLPAKQCKHQSTGDLRDEE